MMEVTINIPGLTELAGAINALAASKTVNIPVMVDGQQIAQDQVQPKNVEPQAQIQPQAKTQREETPKQDPLKEPVQKQDPPKQEVPTSTISYKMDDLAKAAMTLMDAGRQADLQQLLGTFGVASLPELPAEQYGNFATALRGMGAQI